MVGVKEPLKGVVYPPNDRLRTYVEAGALPETTLVEALQASFRRNASATALHTPDGPVSYEDLDQTTDRFAGALMSLGLKPLDRVLFQSENCAELIIALVACLKAGLVPVCSLPAHREKEIGYIGEHVDAKAHIVRGDNAKFDLQSFALSMQEKLPAGRLVVSLRGEPRAGVLAMSDLIAGQDLSEARQKIDAIARDPYQVAIFQLSGGTTGVPKVIPRMQNDYLLNAELTADILDYRSDDVMFMQMPIIHNACMICFLWPTLLTGASFVLAKSMRVEDWIDAFRAAPPTIVGAIRALFPRLETTLSEVSNGLDGIRFFWAPDGARVLREKYGKPAYAMFGMSEGMNMYCRDGDPEEALDWTVGRPMSPFDEVRLVEPGTDTPVGDEQIGEMVCRGPYTLSGYYDAPDRNRDAFTQDGFYKPGDLMVSRTIDGETYYAFAGRTKDVVDRGAEKINCEEVENAVSTHYAVSACAVVGMPDPVLGERVCAYVVLRSGMRKPEVAEMQSHMEAMGMAKFKWPERIEEIEQLPLTKVGKLDKARLRDDIVERMKGDVQEAPVS